MASIKTWIFKLQGYDFLHQVRRNHREGGVAIFIKDLLSCKTVSQISRKNRK